MKKILLSILFIFIAISVLGCNRIDKVDNLEYVERIAESFNEMKLNSENNIATTSNESGNEYAIKVSKQLLDINVQFTKSISSFNSKDYEIAQLHESFIKMNIEHQIAIKNYIKLLKSNTNNNDLNNSKQYVQDTLVNVSNSFYILSDLFLQKTGVDLMQVYY
ncbi:hypothetical protein ACQQ2T_15580 (plasmid) [Paraclostridium tenue]